MDDSTVNWRTFDGNSDKYQLNCCDVKRGIFWGEVTDIEREFVAKLRQQLANKEDIDSNASAYESNVSQEVEDIEVNSRESMNCFEPNQSFMSTFVSPIDGHNTSRVTPLPLTPIVSLIKSLGKVVSSAAHNSTDNSKLYDLEEVVDISPLFMSQHLSSTDGHNTSRVTPLPLTPIVSLNKSLGKVVSSDAHNSTDNSKLYDLEEVVEEVEQQSEEQSYKVVNISPLFMSQHLSSIDESIGSQSDSKEEEVLSVDELIPKDLNPSTPKNIAIGGQSATQYSSPHMSTRSSTKLSKVSETKNNFSQFVSEMNTQMDESSEGQEVEVEDMEVNESVDCRESTVCSESIQSFMSPIVAHNRSRISPLPLTPIVSLNKSFDRILSSAAHNSTNNSKLYDLEEVDEEVEQQSEEQSYKVVNNPVPHLAQQLSPIAESLDSQNNSKTSEFNSTFTLESDVKTTQQSETVGSQSDFKEGVVSLDEQSDEESDKVVDISQSIYESFVNQEVEDIEVNSRESMNCFEPNQSFVSAFESPINGHNGSRVTPLPLTPIVSLNKSLNSVVSSAAHNSKSYDLEEVVDEVEQQSDEESDKVVDISQQTDKSNVSQEVVDKDMGRDSEENQNWLSDNTFGLQLYETTTHIDDTVMTPIRTTTTKKSVSFADLVDPQNKIHYPLSSTKKCSKPKTPIMERQLIGNSFENSGIEVNTKLRQHLANKEDIDSNVSAYESHISQEVEDIDVNSRESMNCFEPNQSFVSAIDSHNTSRVTPLPLTPIVSLNKSLGRVVSSAAHNSKLYDLEEVVEEVEQQSDEELDKVVDISQHLSSIDESIASQSDSTFEFNSTFTFEPDVKTIPKSETLGSQSDEESDKVVDISQPMDESNVSQEVEDIEVNSRESMNCFETNESFMSTIDGHNTSCVTPLPMVLQNKSLDRVVSSAAHNSKLHDLEEVVEEVQQQSAEQSVKLADISQPMESIVVQEVVDKDMDRDSEKNQNWLSDNTFGLQLYETNTNIDDTVMNPIRTTTIKRPVSSIPIPTRTTKRPFSLIPVRKTSSKKSVSFADSVEPKNKIRRLSSTKKCSKPKTPIVERQLIGNSFENTGIEVNAKLRPQLANKEDIDSNASAYESNANQEVKNIEVSSRESMDCIEPNQSFVPPMDGHNSSRVTPLPLTPIVSLNKSLNSVVSSAAHNSKSYDLEEVVEEVEQQSDEESDKVVDISQPKYELNVSQEVVDKDVGRDSEENQNWLSDNTFGLQLYETTTHIDDTVMTPIRTTTTKKSVSFADSFEPQNKIHYPLSSTKKRSKPKTPLMERQLIGNSFENTGIEVNAQDLLSPFNYKQMANKASSVAQTMASDVNTTCSLVDLGKTPQQEQPVRKKSQSLMKGTPRLSNARAMASPLRRSSRLSGRSLVNSSLNDSTLDFIINELKCNTSETDSESFLTSDRQLV